MTTVLGCAAGRIRNTDLFFGFLFWRGEGGLEAAVCVPSIWRTLPSVCYRVRKGVVTDIHSLFWSLIVWFSELWPPQMETELLRACISEGQAGRPPCVVVSVMAPWPPQENVFQFCWGWLEVFGKRVIQCCLRDQRDPFLGEWHTSLLLCLGLPPLFTFPEKSLCSRQVIRGLGVSGHFALTVGQAACLETGIRN